VPKTVYRSSCRDKHNCQRRDSNLDPLTPQSDALTTRLLRPAYVSYVSFDIHKDESYTGGGRVYLAAQGTRHCNLVAVEQKFNME